MKVEVVKTLKSRVSGGVVYRKRGTVFDDAVSPIPPDVKAEIKAKKRSIRIISDDRPATPVDPEMAASENPEIDAAEIDNENENEADENDPDFVFPELERLIELKGSVAEVGRTLDVTYVTIGRWRKSRPKPDVVAKIKEELGRLTINDRGRVGNTPSAGSEGFDQ